MTAIRSTEDTGVNETIGTRGSGTRTRQLRFGLALTATAGLLVLSSSPDLDPPAWLVLALAAVALLGAALPVHLAAVRVLGRGRFSADLIATLAMLGAMAWAGAAVLTGRPHADAFDALIAASALSLALTFAHLLIRDTGAEVAAESVPVWWAPVLIALAALAGLIWTVTSGLTAGLMTMLAVLVVAAPATLTLTHGAIRAALRRQGTRLGIRAADPRAPQAAMLVDTVVLDKDGTVTTGHLRVTSVDPFDPGHERNMRWFAGAVEQECDDRIGRALARPLGQGRLTKVKRDSGRGVSGWVDRHPVRVGHPDWLGLNEVGELGTTVAVEVDGHLLGSITLGDVVRDEAREAVSRLLGADLTPVLVSGDTTANTEDIAERVGVATAVAPADAGQRTEVVASRRAEGHAVAFIGSGADNTAAAEHADLLITDDRRLSSAVTVVVEDIAVDRVSDVLGLLRSVRPRHAALMAAAQVVTVAAALVAATGVLGLLGAGAVVAGTAVLFTAAGTFPLRP